MKSHSLTQCRGLKIAPRVIPQKAPVDPLFFRAKRVLMRKSYSLKWMGAAITLGSLLVSSCPAQSEYGAPPAAPAAPVGGQISGEWPRVYTAGTTTNTIYQPQVESWDGYTLKARNAVAVRTPEHPQPVYGVITVQATTFVNKSERTVNIENARILSADFPTSPQGVYLAELRQSFPKEFPNVSLDRITTSLAVSKQEEKAATQPLNNAPPQIIFANRPSLLVYVDGAPNYQPVSATRLSRVINTRVLLLKDNVAGALYLHVLDGYLSAPDLNGPWTVAAAPPPGGDLAEDAARRSRNVDLLEGQANPDTGLTPQLTATSAPSIYVSTKPAELITFEGQPVYAPVPGTQLLYVTNTTADVFKSNTDRQNYVLISGRWFRASSLNGPWQFVPSNELPRDFAQIPDSSPKENVKASVAGTPQAREAAIENSIPQSTRLSRTTQIETPQIDGPPKMASIEGTALSYVVNSDTPIIQVGDPAWFACQNGVWFTGGSVYGPWSVAASIPPEIYSIPPACPIYYTTFCHVYNATPDYVWDGYTPGYLGAVATPYGTVAFGTGYYYQPWIGDVWFGSPLTWGLGCALTWTPWFGWNFGFGFGWSWGNYARGWGWHPPGPWWGPYRSWGRTSWGRMAAWGPGGWAHTGVNLYNRNFARAGSFNTFGVNSWHGVYGRSYNSRTGQLSAGHRATVNNVFTSPSHFGGQTRTYGTGNNAFATRNSGVFMRDNGTSSGWRSVTPERSYPDSTFSDLNRENSAREMGNQRFDTFRNTYPSGGFHSEQGFGGARSPGGFGGGRGFGGGGRGGGGGRR